MGPRRIHGDARTRQPGKARWSRTPDLSARGLALALCLCAVAAIRAQAAWQYPGCKDVSDADFKYITLLQRKVAPDPDLSEPLKLAFDMDATGHVDIYYVERLGKVKRYNGAAKTVDVLADMNVFKGPNISGDHTDQGVEGIALDPDFKTNHWVYLFYSPDQPVVFRVSRFTLAGSKLDLKSESILLDIPNQRQICCHTGGAMAFDAWGDLWIAVGANTSRYGKPLQMDETHQYASEEWGASSTAGLRGGILRIHPDASKRGYSIPKGNFGDYFAQAAIAKGNTALAAKYDDTALVKPEIFVKGTRNPYSLTVDRVRHWVTVGDVGPDDNGLITEEHNLWQHPVFAGWPYFTGANHPQVGNKDPLAPTNTSKWNKGLTMLPPAEPAIHPYAKSCAITGPIYQYDGDLNSPVKLPPHFNRKWIVGDLSKNKLTLLSLDAAGQKVEKEEPIFAKAPLSNPIDIQTGPDGAIYVINYSGYYSSTGTTTIGTIQYTGDCRPALPKLEQIDPVAARDPLGNPRATHARGQWLNIGIDAGLRAPEGVRGFRIHDLRGKLVWEGAVLPGRGAIQLPSHLRSGAVWVQWTEGQ